MKLALPLAIDIAESVAASRTEEFDIAAKAHELVAEHPGAEATIAEVAETLQEELAALPRVAGVRWSRRLNLYTTAFNRDVPEEALPLAPGVRRVRCSVLQWEEIELKAPIR